MKKTKLPKKLVLNKKTVTNLNFLQQKMIKGGCTCYHETCATACGTCDTCENTCGFCPTPTYVCKTRFGLICIEDPLTDAQSICCP